MSNPSSPVRSARKRSAALLAAGVLVGSLAFGGAVSAQAASASLTSNFATATAGGTILLAAQGFTPGDVLTFDFDGTPLTTAPVFGSAEAADANGQYSGDAWLPDDAALGTHTISVTDASNSGVASTTITVVPQPTASVTPSSIAVSDYLANGVTATFSGFTPGETISFGISDATSGTQIFPDQVAGPNGDVTLHWVPQAGGAFATEGTYALRAASSDLHIISEPVSFTVTADVAASEPAPAATPANAPVAPAATPVAHAATFTG